MKLILGRLAASSVLSIGVLISAVSAQTAQAPATAPAPDPEVQLDDGLKSFGYLAGLALGCASKESKSAMERDALNINAEISRLLGSDRAFLFAAGFGYGTSIQIKPEDCKAVTNRYQARVGKFRKSRGE